MNLKRVLIDLLTAEQLKDLCNELELEADRRSPAAMTEALASAKRAKPERLIAPLTVAQLREALVQFDRPTDGKRDELARRILEAGGRTWPLPGPALELEAQVQPPPRGSEPEVAPTTRMVRTGLDTTEQYRHATEAVQRPDVGVQDQFQAKKAPRTYRYDSSLDPALSWDEQRERDLGEWLLGLVVRLSLIHI